MGRDGRRRCSMQWHSAAWRGMLSMLVNSNACACSLQAQIQLQIQVQQQRHVAALTCTPTCSQALGKTLLHPNLESVHPPVLLLKMVLQAACTLTSLASPSSAHSVSSPPPVPPCPHRDTLPCSPPTPSPVEVPKVVLQVARHALGGHVAAEAQLHWDSAGLGVGGGVEVLGEERGGGREEEGRWEQEPKELAGSGGSWLTMCVEMAAQVGQWQLPDTPYSTGTASWRPARCRARRRTPRSCRKCVRSAVHHTAGVRSPLFLPPGKPSFHRPCRSFCHAAPVIVPPRLTHSAACPSSVKQQQWPSRPGPQANMAVISSGRSTSPACSVMPRPPARAASRAGTQVDHSPAQAQDWGEV
jgi:hypothetical protein